MAKGDNEGVAAVVGARFDDGKIMKIVHFAIIDCFRFQEVIQMEK